MAKGPRSPFCNRWWEVRVKCREIKDALLTRIRPVRCTGGGNREKAIQKVPWIFPRVPVYCQRALWHRSWRKNIFFLSFILIYFVASSWAGISSFKPPTRFRSRFLTAFILFYFFFIFRIILQLENRPNDKYNMLTRSERGDI